MKPLSDWQTTGVLVERGAATLGDYDLYKACVSFAINGGAHESEARLPAEYRALLEIRRRLKAGQLDEVRSSLETWAVPKGHEREFELLGDRAYVRAMLHHRRSEMAASAASLGEAAELYRRGRDEHRTLRALVSRKIIESTLETYLTGELFFLKQKAEAAGFYDLVGNIEKGAVTELLLAGEATEAANAAARAIEAYRRDGCPEDRAVSQCLLAISLWLADRKDEARRAEKAVLVRGGKVSSYEAILAALFAGRTPELPAGHPLAAVAWSAAGGPKENSIPGRILRRRRDGAAGREELIREVWGAGAVHPSYDGRLYTAIKDLRGKYRIAVAFDGARYRLD